jgi:hypothetical protein
MMLMVFYILTYEIVILQAKYYAVYSYYYYNTPLYVHSYKKIILLSFEIK